MSWWWLLLAFHIGAIVGYCMRAYREARRALRDHGAPPSLSYRFDGKRLHIRNRNPTACECCGNTVDCDCA